MQAFSSYLLLAAALLIMTGPAGAQASRAAAEIGCAPAGKPLVYDCTIKIREARSREPLSGLTLTVRADMPSMPMAHNLRPVPGRAAGEPGTYEARLELEMLGEWAVQVDVSGPMRDRIVKVLRFEENSASEPSSRATGAGHQPGHKH